MKNLRNLLAQLRRVLSMELGLFRGRRALVLSTLGVMIIPTVYAVTYLSSVWDPYSRADNLPVALVNEDRGATYQGTPVHLGDTVVDTLEKKHSFRYIRYAHAEEARDAVREGRLSFAVLIPEDFSEHAVLGKHEQAGKLVVFSSEGNQYMAAGLAKRFSVELAHQINESLNTKRWDRVLTKVSSASEDLSRLREGVQQLRDGAHRLDEGLEKASTGAEHLSGGLARAVDGSERLAQGAGQVAGGTVRLTGGMAKLGDGIRIMNERLPSDEDLNRLASGTATLAEKNAELARGLGQLEQGAVKLTEGTGQLKDGAARVPFVGGRIAEGAGKIQGGLGQLHDGLAKASDGGLRLAEGATRVNDGVSRLTGGMQQLGAGIRTMAQKVPDTATLDTLATGANTVAEKTETLSEGLGQLHGGSRKLAAGLGQLEDGSTRIAEGLDTLYTRIPARVPTLEGDAQGLAASVEPEIEAADPVANNGTAFAPYFVALSLWVGAVMTSFLFHLRTLAEPLRTTHPLARLLGKAGVPAAIVLGQSLVMTLGLHFALGIALPHPVLFVLLAATGSLTFLSLVMLLVRNFGDAGKGAAVLLLILQISSAGGAFPIELSHPFFQAIHPLLPFTHLMKALRAVLFGAYGGAWGVHYLWLVGTALTALGLALVMGRWKYVPEERYVPALDI